MIDAVCSDRVIRHSQAFTDECLNSITTESTSLDPLIQRQVSILIQTPYGRLCMYYNHCTRHDYQ